MCGVRWLKVGSAESKALFPETQIRPIGGEKFDMNYYPRYRLADEIAPRTDDTRIRIVYKVVQTSVYMFYWTEERAKHDLAEMQKADQPQSGVIVIRGRVEDRQHQPLEGALIDLL